MAWQKMFVQIVKNLFHKAREEGADLFKALRIQKYSASKQLTITYVDASKQECEVKITNVKCSKTMAWIANRNA